MPRISKSDLLTMRNRVARLHHIRRRAKLREIDYRGATMSKRGARLRTGEKCEQCGKKMRRTIKDKYQYLESGLSNVVLDQIPVYECECGEQIVGLPNVERLHTLIFEKLLMKPSPLRGEEVRFLRKWMGAKGVDFAKMVKVHPTTLSKWESGDQAISEEHNKLIRFAVIVTISAQAKQQMTEAYRKVADQYLDLLHVPRCRFRPDRQHSRRSNVPHRQA